jgi:hypothetical protein
VKNFITTEGLKKLNPEANTETISETIILANGKAVKVNKKKHTVLEY